MEKNTEISEDKIKQLYNSSLSQKKLALEIFHTWNKKKREDLKRAKIILDKLFSRIDKNLTISKKRFELIVIFFKKINFNMSKTIDLQKNLNIFEISNLEEKKKNPKIIKNTNFSKCINAFESNFEQFRENFGIIEQKIENQIIQKILREKLFIAEKNLSEICKKIININKDLQRLSLSTNKNYKIFITNIKSSIKKNLKGKPSQINIFDDLLKFTSQLNAMSKKIQNFSEHFFEIHSTAIELEKQRNSAIKESLLNLMTILSSYFGEEKIKVFRESKELLSQFDLQNFADDSFDILKLLNDFDKNFILEKSESDFIDMKSVEKCVKKCLVIDQEEMLCNFYYNRFIGKIRSGFFSKKTTDIIIFFTLDYFYSLYAMKNNVICEFLGNIPLKNVTLKTNFRNCLMEFSFEQKGWLYNSVKKFEISLTKDEIEEWICFHQKHCAFFKGKEAVSVMDDKVTDLSISDTSICDDQGKGKERNDSIDVLGLERLKNREIKTQVGNDEGGNENGDENRKIENNEQIENEVNNEQIENEDIINQIENEENLDQNQNEENLDQNKNEENLDQNHNEDNLDQNHNEENLDQNQNEENLVKNQNEENLVQNQNEENLVQNQNLTSFVKIENTNDNKIENANMTNNNEINNSENEKVLIKEEEN